MSAANEEMREGSLDGLDNKEFVAKCWMKSVVAILHRKGYPKVELEFPRRES